VKNTWMRTACMVMLVVVSVGFAGSFTWTGNGSDDDWDTTANWTSSSCMGCYPDDTGDDATIPTPACCTGYAVNLITESIDDLTIEGDVDFSGASGDPVLTVDSVTIIGPAVLTMSDASIRTLTSWGCEYE